MPYVHAPLPDHGSIRVMHLWPGAFEEEIQFTLEVIPLPTTKQCQVNYEAVSYTWGDATIQREIFHRDSNSDGILAALKVTTNCYDALRRLRYTDRAREIWLDAICIDQSNVDERSAQVRIMGQIYAGAKEVIIYIGESADGSDTVMQWLANNYRTREQQEEIDLSIYVLAGLQYFAKRPWFFRTWTLQEVANARAATLQCGKHSISWEVYSYFFHKWHERNAVLDVLGLRHYFSRLGVTGFAPVFFHILKATRDCLASDPRDKIYGILPLFHSASVPELLRPDYRITSTELFVRVAHYLHNEIGLKMFGEAIEYRANIAHDLPSWVPFWTTLFKGACKIQRKDEYRELRAGGDVAFADEISLREDSAATTPQQMRMACVPIGPLTELTPTYKDGRYDIFSKWVKLADKTLGADRTGATHPASLIRLPFYCLITQHLPASEDPVVEEKITHMSERYYSNIISSHENHTTYNRILRSCTYRKLATIDGSTLGLVPEQAELGDVIFVIPGVSVPLLLRRRGNVYHLIGETYVQGIMFGEALEGKDVSSMQTVVLE